MLHKVNIIIILYMVNMIIMHDNYMTNIISTCSHSNEQCKGVCIYAG